MLYQTSQWLLYWWISRANFRSKYDWCLSNFCSLRDISCLYLLGFVSVQNEYDSELLVSRVVSGVKRIFFVVGYIYLLVRSISLIVQRSLTGYSNRRRLFEWTMLITASMLICNTSTAIGVGEWWCHFFPIFLPELTASFEVQGRDSYIKHVTILFVTYHCVGIKSYDVIARVSRGGSLKYFCEDWENSRVNSRVAPRGMQLS